MNTQPAFNENVPCDHCKKRGAFDLTSLFLCRDCWSKWSKGQIREIIQETATHIIVTVNLAPQHNQPQTLNKQG